MRYLFLIPLIVLGCGKATEELSELASDSQGPYEGVSAIPNNYCLGTDVISIFDSFHNPPTVIKIDVPAVKPCGIKLAGFEPLTITDAMTKKPWDKRFTYNAQIRHRDHNKCLSFGEGGGIRNVSWQKCVDPQTIGDLVKANSQQWTMRPKVGGALRW